MCHHNARGHLRICPSTTRTRAEVVRTYPTKGARLRITTHEVIFRHGKRGRPELSEAVKGNY